MNYNLSNLFLESFGLKVNKAYDPQYTNGKADYPQGGYGGIEMIEDLEEAVRLSYLGTPVIFPIIFIGGTYRKYDNNGKIIYVDKGDFDLPATCVVGFRRPKIIEKTRVSGGYGTVKEIFAFDDWDITIEGFLLPDPKQRQGFTTPIEQDLEFESWNKIIEAIQIEGEQFNKRDIDKINIEDIVTQSLRGQPKVRPFTIKASGDENIDFEKYK